MRLYEYEGKILAAKTGIKVPVGEKVSSAEEAVEFAKKINKAVVLKAQILAGGRGKAGGIKIVDNPEDVKSTAEKLLKSTINGHKVKILLAEEKLSIAKEFYIGITFDEITKRSVLLLTEAGGVDVEEGALEKGVIKYYIDPFLGLRSYKAKELAKKLGLKGKALTQATASLVSLFKLYKEYDAATAEINPMVLTEEGEIFAADMRVDIDDDALFRQKKLPDIGIPLREERGREPTELEKKAAEIDQLDHRGVAGRVVEFDGDIACIIGGGGASLTIFDAITKYGGKPANYCEVGGNPTVTKVKELTKLLVRKPGIKALAVITNVISNTRVDLIARGVIKGLLEVGIDPAKFPIVFRSAGSWEDDGYKILGKYNVKWFDRTRSMDEAAKYVVNMVKELGVGSNGNISR